MRSALFSFSCSQQPTDPNATTGNLGAGGPPASNIVADSCGDGCEEGSG
jgi:hypothetical protein